jgi:predicted ribosome quality control (RQC) complex YloA/Tae2 family protein
MEKNLEKKEINSLDLRFLMKELNERLANGFIRKIYQYESPFGDERSHQFLMDVFAPGKGSEWLYFDRNSIFITVYRKPSPSEPPSFCMTLRKYLEGTKILEIRQHEFDRIIEIKTSNNVLIIELFSDGNVILCDSEKNIILPLYFQEWKDRNVKPKMQYQYPPHRINPFAVSFDYFREYLSQFDRKIIAVLAAGFGFGTVYAKEICMRSKIDETIPSERLSANLSVHLFNTIRDLDNVTIEPTIYENFVSSFKLENSDVGKVRKHTEKFSEALDDFFSEQQIRMAEEFEKGMKDSHKEKFDRIISEQESSLKKWSEKKQEKKSKADLIYSNFLVVEKILEAINRAKSSGLEWSEIKDTVRKELPDESVLKEIRENEGKAIVILEGQEIELDFRKSATENAGSYYEGSKLAKKKIVGAHRAMEETKRKMEKPVETEKIPKPEKREKLHIRKYTEPKDFVFHSVTHGSPFVVVKSGGKEITPETKKEAAEFAAAYSKAWPSKLGTADIYCIRPEQVSKQAKPGEYLAKGAFMIYGEREWFRNIELKTAIGVKAGEKGMQVIAGPLTSVQKQTRCFALVRPGDADAKELAKKIRIKILMCSQPEQRSDIEKIPLDEFQRFIPAGEGTLIE